MRSGFSLGRVFGIRIEADWGWVFVFLLITWIRDITRDEVHLGVGAQFLEKLREYRPQPER